MNITANGKIESVDGGISVEKFLMLKRIDPSCVVVELNRDIVKTEKFSSVMLKDGDTLEILRFVGGG